MGNNCEDKPYFQSWIHKWAAWTILRTRRDVALYSRYYTCWPNCERNWGSPPLLMLSLILVSLMIWLVGFFGSFHRCMELNQLNFDEIQSNSVSEKQCSSWLWYFDSDRICHFGIEEFILDPYQTSSVWRFFTYPLNSINLAQLLFNVLVYSFIGVPFEMVLGSGRTALLLTAVAGLGGFASLTIFPSGFVVGGSVFAQFFLCSIIRRGRFFLTLCFRRAVIFATFVFIASVLIQTAVLEYMGWSFLATLVVAFASSIDFVFNFYMWSNTRIEPRMAYNKLVLSPVPTCFGCVFGLVVGCLIMTGYQSCRNTWCKNAPRKFIKNIWSIQYRI